MDNDDPLRVIIAGIVSMMHAGVVALWLLVAALAATLAALVVVLL